MSKKLLKIRNFRHLELRHLACDVTGGIFGYRKPKVSLYNLVKYAYVYVVSIGIYSFLRDRKALYRLVL